jgi:hypothetical protein
VNAPSAPPEPPTLEAVQGLHRRRRLRWPGGEDVSTLVLWMQVGALHVDLRVPEGLPDLSGADSVADIPPDALRALAACEGIAGTTAVAGGLCTWIRRVNWRGPAEPDVGRLEATPEGLLETGVLADYEELWTPEPPEGDGARAARVLTRPDGQLCVLLREGPRFLMGRAAPEAMTAAPLAERLETALAARHRAAVARLLDMEFCAGRLTPYGGGIEISTLPFNAGRPAFAGDPWTAPAPRLTAPGPWRDATL